MKKLNILIVGLAFILGISSCKKLDVEPTGFYSDKNFYNTVEDAEASLLYAYDALTLVSYAPVTFYLAELSTDNSKVKSSEGADAQAFVNWEVTGQNQLLTQYYRCAYIAINRANAVLENVEGRGFNETDVNRIMGEAYFLRAWNHFNIVRAFGIAPLQKSLVDEISETNASLPADMQEVYSFLIDDLNKAIDLLEVNRVAGRADKVAAQALLAKVYLFAASAKESGVSKYDALSESVDALYAKAAEFAGYVINEQGEYGHDSDLQNIYNIEAPNGPEHIFIMSMDRSGTQEGDYSKLSKYFLPWIAGGEIHLMNSDSSLTPTHDGWSVFQSTETLLAKFEEGDKRKDELIVSEIFDENGNSTGSVADGVIPYAFTRKYVDANYTGDKTSTRPYLLRYSDIQLIYAEATADASGLEQFNMIRNRAGVSELETLPSVDEFRNLVIQERQKELAFEGDRLWDLRRKNIVQENVTEAAGLSPDELSFFPIPQRELDLNPNIN
jgi:hypothetical protein